MSYITSSYFIYHHSCARLQIMQIMQIYSQQSEKRMETAAVRSRPLAPEAGLNSERFWKAVFFHIFSNFSMDQSWTSFSHILPNRHRISQRFVFEVEEIWGVPETSFCRCPGGWCSEIFRRHRPEGRCSTGSTGSTLQQGERGAFSEGSRCHVLGLLPAESRSGA